MKLTVSYPARRVPPSCHTSLAAGQFGIGRPEARETLVKDLDLPLEAGDVVCFTGPSGSGKSSLLRAAAAQLEGVRDAASVRLGSKPLVDSLPGNYEEVTAALAACGLGDAKLFLKTPAELSDGERYRFRLAKAVSRKPNWLLLDEFTATLDRPLAKTIAYNLRRTNRRTGIGLLVATTHEDVLEDLDAAVHVACELGGEPAVHRRGAKKKRRRASRASARSARAPARTGRTFLGGITGEATSASRSSSTCSGTASGRSASACSVRRRSPCVCGTSTSASRANGRGWGCGR